VLPEFAHLEDTVRVIDVAEASGGDLLHVLMNAESEEAVGVLGAPDGFGRMA